VESREAKLRRRRTRTRKLLFVVLALTVIGGVAEHGGNALHTPQGTVTLEDRGWEHFRSGPP